MTPGGFVFSESGCGIRDPAGAFVRFGEIFDGRQFSVAVVLVAVRLAFPVQFER